MRSLITALCWVSLLLIACGKKPAEEQEAAKAPTAAVVADAATGNDRPAVEEMQIDPATGFKMGGDWQLVRAHCTGCHSAKLITQQRGTAQQWLALIRWMQETQNLWKFDADTESRIITYLAENYPPDEARRRAAIPRALMPPNPYANSTLD